MKPTLITSVLILLAGIILNACGTPSSSPTDFGQLRGQLDSIVTRSKGTVGIAIIAPDGDTLTVNNHIAFPLMSVFKLHEAIAVASVTDSLHQSFDSTLTISRNELSTRTWSPMLHDYPGDDNLKITVGELIKYCLLVSDNNASNLLFDHIVSVSNTDSIVRKLRIPQEFQLRHTERRMQADHHLSYDNCSSPLSCAALIRKLFTDSIVTTTKQDSIISWLAQCSSAGNRMAAAMASHPDIRLHHRTGSGYTNDRGQIIAVNDVGIITLPDGSIAAIAILIKDYAGPQDEADAEIAGITDIILAHLCN